jgi:hypothetical protein
VRSSFVNTVHDDHASKEAGLDINKEKKLSLWLQDKIIFADCKQIL